MTFTTFSNPYIQLVNPDDPQAILSRLRLDSAIPRKIVEATTPDTFFGNTRKLAFDVGNAANETRAMAGAALNKYVSNPLREHVLGSKLSPAEVKDYYRKRYIALPAGGVAASLGFAAVPGIGETANKYLGDNLFYMMDHGFDKSLSDKGVNLGALKIAEALGNYGNKLKDNSLVTGSAPDTINALGHQVMRRTALASGVTAGGGAALANKQKQDQSNFSNPAVAQHVRKVSPAWRSKLGLGGTILGGVGGALAIHNLFEGEAPAIVDIAGGLMGSTTGRAVGNVIADPLATGYYSVMGVPEQLPTIKKTKKQHLGTTGLLAGATGIPLAAGTAAYLGTNNNNQ